MAKKVVSKFFRIAVEGDTCDGRKLSAVDMQQMVDAFDPRVYGCRINLEHIRGYLPDSDFKRYGDVVELKAETIDDDSALNGKLAMYAKIAPLDTLVEMVGKGQKVYTSIEIQPNFANTGKCYLVGLAVTDDPASLGTEYLEFCSTAKHNPLKRFKASPDNLFSAATLAEMEFEDVPENLLHKITDSVKSIFSRKQASDDARFNDVHEAVTVIAEQVQQTGDDTAARFSKLEAEITGLKKAMTEQATETSQQFSTLANTLDNTENKTQKRRKLSTGGGGDGAAEVLTDC
ncbi:GPO family capsid scaffolding protein [Cedecea davisae]|uniref:GPO family capsid scaffolding protein n=1 Tax=Cedecea davisae TaxID=158484 RepID=A0ABS6DB31_9ENTR|nr:GPO family capsid scaffolding protein [Cedecea davisae]MBU4680432.1 GPO family capsid scaffolding protein [Cedecea davisae]MBU4684924.1 GPO family capsid scaffolding protein [Cedecea davisae]